MSDIIARADVARGTFYLYFESKQQVLLAIVGEFHDHVKRAFEALDQAAQVARPQGPLAVLEASFRGWLEFFAIRADTARVVLREAHAIDDRFEQALADVRRSARTRFATRFRKFQEEGLASRTIDPELAAHFQLGVLDELLTWCVLSETPLEIEKLASQFADFEWNGIRPDRR